MRNLQLLLLALSLNAITCIVALFYMPPEATLGHLYKIIYVHVPPAWTSYVAFTIALITSVLYIVKRDTRYDIASYTSVSLGVFFSGLAILLGSIFSSKAWGTYWEWREPRMTATLIVFLTYIGYLALRSSIGDLEKKKSITAVYSIMAFITVPLSYVAVKIFRSLHPLPELTFEMRILLYIAFLTNLAVYAVLYKILYSTSLEEEKKLLEEEV